MLRLAVIAAVFALAGSGGAIAQSGEDARAAAFRDDCGNWLASLSSTQQHVKDAGWAKVDPSIHPELKAIHALSMSAAKGLSGMSLDAFERKVGERTLYMMISGNVPTPSGPANGCYVYDFEDEQFAADPDAGGVLQAWLGEPPTTSTVQRGMLAQKQWVGPPSHPEFATVRVVSIPAGSPMAKTNFFSGLAWAATASAE